MKAILKTRYINITLFFVAFALRAYTDAVYESKGISSGFIVNLKYVVLIVGIMFCLFQMYIKKRIFKFYKELVSVLLVVGVFFVFTVFLAVSNGDLSSTFVMEIIKLTLPIVYAFCVLNTFEFRDVYNSMIFVLLFSIFGYVLEIGIENFTIQNVTAINFLTSYSPFESHYAAGSAMAMCVFFMYYRENRWLKYLSFLFALLTFKRVTIIFAITLLILPKIVDINKAINIWIKRLTPLLFIIATLVYYYLQLPNQEKIFSEAIGIDINDLTMGRSKYILRLYYGKYTSGGLGSTTQFLGKSIEMDLIKILLEMSIVALAIFVIAYWRCSGKNIYTYVYMLFTFFNLLMSHSLTNAFSWILVFVIIGCITYTQKDDLMYIKYKSKHRKRIRFKFR